jgi:hypothetical protein
MQRKNRETVDLVAKAMEAKEYSGEGGQRID